MKQRLTPSEPWRGPVALAPDARTLAFRREQAPLVHDLWCAAEGEAAMVAEGSREASVFDAFFAPDGRSIAYRTFGKRRGVGLVSLERRSGPSRAGTACAFRPDGSALVVFDPQEGLMELLPDGQERSLAKLHDDGDARRPPVLAAAGGRLALVTHSAEAALVWVVDRGEAPRLVTDVPGAAAWVSPIWSPDSRDLALHVVHPIHRRSAVIVFRDAEGGGEVSYARDLVDATEPPAWSPSGRSIVFFRTPEESYRNARTGAAVLSRIDLESRGVEDLGESGAPTGRLRFLDAKTLVIEAHDGAHLLDVDPTL